MKFFKNQMTMEFFLLHFKNFDKNSGGQLQYVNYVSNEIEVWDGRTDNMEIQKRSLTLGERLKIESIFAKNFARNYEKK